MNLSWSWAWHKQNTWQKAQESERSYLQHETPGNKSQVRWSYKLSKVAPDVTSRKLYLSQEELLTFKPPQARKDFGLS